MKKIVCLFLLWCTCCSLEAQTNSFPDLKQNAIKLNLLSPIFNTINIAYQRLLDPEHSIQVSLSYTDFDDFNENYNYSVSQSQINVTGINLCLDYKINMNGYGLNGLYVGPFLRYLNYNRTLHGGTVYEQTGKYQSGGLGFLFGKQFLFKNAITLDFFAGPVYHIMISREETLNAPRNIYLGYYIEEPYIKGYSLRAGFNVGFAF